MWAELKTLFWLQWKLTRAMFRSRRTSAQLRLVGLLFRLVSLLFTLPMFLLMGIGLAVGLILLSPHAAFEVVMIANTFMFLIWLILPASYNSQLVERFEMSRLFVYPISFRTIVVGSTLISLLTMTGFWTVPLILGEIVGLAYHQPLALPLILLGAVPTFAVLVLTGRIMEDLFDLVAGDRRLRALMLAVLTLPFMLCWVGQHAVQYATDNYSNLPQFVQVPVLEELENLEEPKSFAEFWVTASEALELLQLSRWLIWLPPGWTTAGMGLATRGQWGSALLLLLVSTALVALLLRVHAGITRRLMEGAALSVGAERVRSFRSLQLAGPPTLWALFRKDWIYLWRSPMPRRLLFSSLIMVVAMAFPLRSIAQEGGPGSGDLPPAMRAAAPLMVAGFIITMSNMAVNMGLTANYFGTIDREGFATLALSPSDRRHLILSANLAVLLYAGLQVTVIALGIALLTGSWVVLPLGLYLGLCLQVGGAPAYNLAAIIGPYRTQLKFSGGRQRGNLWGMLAWLTSATPVLALIALPYIFWKPGLVLTLPLGIVYCLGLYALTLKPLAKLLQSREYTILQAVTEEE
jgi:hypothetical protein